MAQDTDFDKDFAVLFAAEFQRVFRLLDRLGGDPDLASDLAQEAFVRLYRRGSLPSSPGAWLVTVGMNLFRNARKTSARRRALTTPSRAARAHADPTPDPGAATEASDSRARVRRALERLPERERHLLLLSAEGFTYREMSGVLGLAEASVGTLLARAREAFKAEFVHVS